MAAAVLGPQRRSIVPGSLPAFVSSRLTLVIYSPLPYCHRFQEACHPRLHTRRLDGADLADGAGALIDGISVKGEDAVHVGPCRRVAWSFLVRNLRVARCRLTMRATGQWARRVEATSSSDSRALRAACRLFFERARRPEAVLARRPWWGWRTSTKAARRGLLRTHSPIPSALGVSVAPANTRLQLLQRDVSLM